MRCNENRMREGNRKNGARKQYENPKTNQQLAEWLGKTRKIYKKIKKKKEINKFVEKRRTTRSTLLREFRGMRGQRQEEQGREEDKRDVLMEISFCSFWIIYIYIYYTCHLYSEYMLCMPDIPGMAFNANSNGACFKADKGGRVI